MGLFWRPSRESVSGKKKWLKNDWLPNGAENEEMTIGFSIMEWIQEKEGSDWRQKIQAVFQSSFAVKGS